MLPNLSDRIKNSTVPVRNRGSRYYELATKQPIKTNTYNKHSTDLSIEEVQILYDSSLWKGIIDKYIVIYESVNNIYIKTSSDAPYNLYIEGKVVDDNGEVLHGIKTGILIYMTPDWAYTETGSIYKLLTKA